MKRKAVLVRLNSLLHPTAEITLLQESNFPPAPRHGGPDERTVHQDRGHGDQSLSLTTPLA